MLTETHRASWPDMVRTFHRRFGYDVGDVPEARTWEQSDRRYGLIAEEYDELRDELRKARPDIAKIAHEGADLIFVILGMFVEMGVDPDEVIREVWRANMTKTVNAAGGKAIKGPGFIEADIEGVIRGQAGS